MNQLAFMWSYYIKKTITGTICTIGLTHIHIYAPKELSENIVIVLSIGQSVPPALCRVYLSYILSGRNPIFGVWMHLGMVECRVSFSGHCDLDLSL